MAEGRVRRRMAAIMAADVVGYTALMAADEAGTYQHLKELRLTIVEPEISKRHGRIFKLMGDGLLAEFESAVDAVESAVAIQRELTERNTASEHRPPIQLRIGIDVGDVIAEGDDLYGEAVNLASRIEQAATPGNIFLSKATFDHVKSKLPVAVTDLGSRKLKNIAEEVPLFRVEGSAKEHRGIKSSQAALSKQLLALLLLMAVAYGLFLGWPHISGGSKQATFAKPAVAVLPFAYSGSDDRWRRLSDGITNDIILDLARSRDLLVMAKNATDGYRGKPASPQLVARELDVQYILSGDIQPTEADVRVTAQLARDDGAVVWSEKFARPIGDIFAIQDELTAKVVSAMAGWQGTIHTVNQTQTLRKNPASYQAYDYFLLGSIEQSKMSRDGAIKAREFYNKALQLDPKLQRVIRETALTYMIQIDGGTTDNVDEAKAKALEYTQQALALEPDDPKALINLGFAYLYYGDFVRAEEPFMRAVELSQSDVDVMILAAGNLFQFGHPEMALELIERAKRLDPHHAYWWNFMLRWAYFYARDFKQALEAANKIESDAPNDLAYVAMINAQLERGEEAKQWAERTLAANPDWSAEYLIGSIGGTARDMESDLLRESARKAGLPECMSVAQLAKYQNLKRLQACEKQRAAG